MHKQHDNMHVSISRLASVFSLPGVRLYGHVFLC